MDQRADDIGSQSMDTAAIVSGAAYPGGIETKTEHDVGGSEQNLEQLRTVIEQTEAKLVKTLDAIQERLSLDYLGEQAGGMILEVLNRRIEEMTSRLSETSSRLGHTTVETIKHNPIPAALLGIGLGWYLFGSYRKAPAKEEQESPGYMGADENDSEALYNAGLEEPGAYEQEERSSHAARARVSKIVRKAKERAGGVQEKAGHVAEQARERAKHLNETVHHGTHSARTGISRIVEERPIALGLVGITIGAIVGLVASGALRDGGFLSGARENIRHKAQELVHDTTEKAGRVVEKAGQAAREEAERQHFVTH